VWFYNKMKDTGRKRHLYLLASTICLYILVFGYNTLYAATPPKPLTVADYDRLVVYYRFSKPDSGIYYAQKGLELSYKQRNYKGIGMMLNHLGIIDENQGRFEQAKQKYQRAIIAYKKANFSEGVADEMIRLGATEMRKANFDKAIAYFLNALKTHEHNHNKRGIMECYDTLGEAYIGQSNYPLALAYLKRGEAYSKQLPLMGLTLYIYNNLGIVYRETGDLKQATAYLQKGVNLSNEPQYAGLHVTLLNNLGTVYAKAGFKSKAIELQLKALAQARVIKNYLRELLTLNGLADTYGADEPEKALFYLKQALVLARQKGANKPLLETLNRMAVLYERQGNYKEALRITKQEHALADSMFSITKATEIANLQSNYELHKSRANVERLKYLNTRQAAQRNISLCIAAGILILLLVSIYHYRRSRRFNQRLHALNNELKESNAVKDKLFSVIGHDLRSPLATVRNFLYILEDDEDLTADEKNEVIKNLAENCDASLDTLDKLLKWGQMQIKGVRLNQTVFEPMQVVAKNLLLFKNNAKEKSIKVSNDVDNSIVILADQDQFDFIIRNLLSNAIKFTPGGGNVWISSTQNTQTGYTDLRIKDTGIGLPEHRLSEIFDRDNESTDGTNGEKGTSLGLLMCKEYAEANGGKMSAESAEGKGTTFIVSLKTASKNTLAKS
jgi:signal transduction histidine kinase